MKTLKQSATTNDISIGSDGDLALCDGLEAYANVIGDAVRTVVGELQLDSEFGVDYFGTVFDNINGIPEWKFQVRDIINSYDFVESVGEISVEIDSGNRTLSYDLHVTTDHGETVISQ